jgi:Zn finger protein HypA/HybF involved in hydrogenase expression
MKCRDCDARITKNTAQKNLGKCNKCKKIDMKIAKEMKKARSW